MVLAIIILRYNDDGDVYLTMQVTTLQTMNCYTLCWANLASCPQSVSFPSSLSAKITLNSSPSIEPQIFPNYDGELPY